MSHDTIQPDVSQPDIVRPDVIQPDVIQRYYGETLTGSGDLKTGACCSPESMPAHLQAWLRQLPREVTDRFYGCGSPIPAALAGATVLDLGCGTGRDAFLVSHLVGPHGRVIGLDMTPTQIEVARNAQAQHREQTGLANLEFRVGRIEDLAAAGIDADSIDVVISNCVLNLSTDKTRVFSEIFRVLKPGGELFFSDIYADRRIPQDLLEDPVLRGECLAGAMYAEDFRRLLATHGVADHRVTARSPVPLLDAQIQDRIGMVNFESVTVRAFKLDLEDRCEDFGQFVTYRGGIAHHPQRFVLDDHHCFECGRPLPVCGNTAAMLSGTRYAPHFEVSAPRAHSGLFGCTSPTPSGGEPAAACC